MRYATGYPKVKGPLDLLKGELFSCSIGDHSALGFALDPTDLTGFGTRRLLLLIPQSESPWQIRSLSNHEKCLAFGTEWSAGSDVSWEINPAWGFNGRLSFGPWITEDGPVIRAYNSEGAAENISLASFDRTSIPSDARIEAHHFSIWASQVGRDLGNDPLIKWDRRR